MYKIQLLPLFRRDYKSVIDYIGNRLSAPGAARALTVALFKAIDRIAQFPYSCKLYTLSDPSPVEYRIVLIKNYAVFYIVDEESKTVTFYRMLYGRRNFDQLL